MAKKRLLTIDDLVKFCSEQNFSSFSAKEAGYKIAVQMPTTFEATDEADDDHRGMVKIRCRVILKGKNLNGSFISQESADAAALTIKDRPLLAHIHQLDDGTWDFESHNYMITQNDDGDEEIEYIERQIGSFSNEEPFWETDMKTGLEYLVAYAWIAEEYTRAAEILRNKNGFSRSSCELSIEEMAFNAKEKYLDLQKFYVSGTTLLGSRDDGTQVKEGMQGAGATLVDFSEQNNSVFTQTHIMEVLEGINQKIDNLSNFNTQIRGKEENRELMNKFEELLEKYGKTADEITFEVDGLSDEEMEAKFAELFDEQTETPSEDNEPDLVMNEENGHTEAEEKFVKTFELSHSDIRSALYALLVSFEEADNDWYFITDVYDDHFVYEGCFNEKSVYDQKYTKDGDNIAFDGERIHLNKELLTDSELAELTAMRSNYAALVEKVAQYEAEPEKLEVLGNKCYAKIQNTDEYQELSKRENYFALTIDELTNRLDAILLNAAKTDSLEFSESSETQKVEFTRLPLEKPGKSGRYGGIFRK